MNKPTKIALIVLTVLVLMLGEYRYIMTHQQIERGHNGNIYSTVFGITDTYYVEGWQGYQTKIPCSNL